MSCVEAFVCKEVGYIKWNFDLKRILKQMGGILFQVRFIKPSNKPDKNLLKINDVTFERFI